MYLIVFYMVIKNAPSDVKREGGAKTTLMCDSHSNFRDLEIILLLSGELLFYYFSM